MGTYTLDRNEPDTLGPCISEGSRERVGSKTGATVMPLVTPHVGRGRLEKGGAWF